MSIVKKLLKENLPTVSRILSSPKSCKLSSTPRTTTHTQTYNLDFNSSYFDLTNL